MRMVDKVPIGFGSTATILKILGSLYRNPAKAIKEHVSNAVDEHIKAKGLGKARAICKVIFTLEKDKVTIEYPYGMSKEEFKDALQRVGKSIKKDMDTAQIGRIGIGLFCFLYIGKKCTFISKKDKGYETIKVILREGSDDAEFVKPMKREKLSDAGINIVISGLRINPIKPRGPLLPAKLQKLFAEQFDPFLKKGLLEIEIISKGKSYNVKPLKIELPNIAEHYKDWHLSKDRDKQFSLDFYFDRSGKGKVGIRHIGVAVVDDIKRLDAYGLEESIYANGYIKGFIDADFLKPLPAREGFEENNDWMNLLNELDLLLPSIEAEVEDLIQEEAEKKLNEIQKKAVKLTMDILNIDEFKKLE